MMAADRPAAEASSTSPASWGRLGAAERQSPLGKVAERVGMTLDQTVRLVLTEDRAGIDPDVYRITRAECVVPLS